jgi:hypothetical protein
MTDELLSGRMASMRLTAAAAKASWANFEGMYARDVPQLLDEIDRLRADADRPVESWLDLTLGREPELIRAWRDGTARFIGQLGRAEDDRSTVIAAWWSDADTLLDEIDRLTAERDRLRELVDEGLAVNDKLTEALRAAAADLEVERGLVSDLRAGRHV